MITGLLKICDDNEESEAHEDTSNTRKSGVLLERVESDKSQNVNVMTLGHKKF